MDKETLSNYGWVVIVIIVLVLLMGLATPFGNFIANGAMSALNSFKEASTFDLFDSDDSSDGEGETDSEGSEYGKAIQMWDISETKGVDNVWMTYYQPETTSYSSRMTTTEVYEGGTVYITGTGNMDDEVYKYFLNEEGYIQQIVNFCEEKCGYNVRYEILNSDEDIFHNTHLKLKVYIDDENAGSQNGREVEYFDFNSLDVTDESLYKFVPTAVVVDEGVTNVSLGAFMASHITEVTLPSSVKSISAAAFGLCTQLTTINLNEGLESIGINAFGYCTSLTEITIPDSVTTLGECVFSDCTALTSITYKGITYTDADTFNDAVGEMVWADAG